MIQNNNQNLVMTVNEIFHNLEAEDYDSRHPEILKFEQKNWQAVINNYISVHSNSPKKIYLLQKSENLLIMDRQLLEKKLIKARVLMLKK